MTLIEEVAANITDHEHRVARLETLETKSGYHHSLVMNVAPAQGAIMARVRLMPGTGRDYTIQSWSIGADVSGSIQIDVWKDTQAAYPPTNADSITGGNEISLSGAIVGYDGTLTGWTTTINHGDWLFFYVDSLTTITEISLTLELE